VPGDAIFYGPQLIVVERDLLPKPKQVCFGLDALSLAGFFGHLEVAASTGHAVRTLIKEVIGAIPVTEIE
jgi:hypothetical protein